MAKSQTKPKQLYHDYWHTASCHCLDIQTSLIIALLKLLMLKKLLKFWKWLGIPGSNSYAGNIHSSRGSKDTVRTETQTHVRTT